MKAIFAGTYQLAGGLLQGPCFGGYSSCQGQSLIILQGMNSLKEAMKEYEKMSM